MTYILKNTLVSLTFGLSVATMLAVPTLFAQAAVPTDKSVRELVNVTHLNETIKQMSSKDSLQKIVNDSMLSSLVTDDMSTAQRQKLIKVFSNYSSSIFDDEYIETINEAQIQAYVSAVKKYFTQEEVDAQIDFYESDLGASIIEKQPIMMQEYGKDVRAIMTQNVSAELKKALPIMIEELKALK